MALPCHKAVCVAVHGLHGLGHDSNTLEENIGRQDVPTWKEALNLAQRFDAMRASPSHHE